ncbi:MAG TPA: hypothetical protein G4O19_01485 [Dehalococcoidia bacterium]|nr:hypothetical protein [Dehalococcoidia bacterium]
MEKQSSRDIAIKELKVLIEKYANSRVIPRAIGGPFNLSPEEMLREVENDTDIGKKIAEAFAVLKKQFPDKKYNP